MRNKVYNIGLNVLEVAIVSQAVVKLLENTDSYISASKITQSAEEVDTLLFHFCLESELLQMVFGFEQTGTISYTPNQWRVAVVALEETLELLKDHQLLAQCQQWLLNQGFCYTTNQIAVIYHALINNIKKCLANG